MNLLFIIADQSLHYLIVAHFGMAALVFIIEYIRKRSIFNFNSIFWIIFSFLIPFIGSVFYFLGMIIRSDKAMDE